MEFIIIIIIIIIISIDDSETWSVTLRGEECRLRVCKTGFRGEYLSPRDENGEKAPQ